MKLNGSILESTTLRTQAIGLVQASDWANGALSVSLFPQMKHFLSFHGLFFLYGAAGFRHVYTLLIRSHFKTRLKIHFSPRLPCWTFLALLIRQKKNI